MNEHEKAFEEAYKGLNSGQKEAVDAIEGPVMVIAGPGTGKTQVLTLRIANILKKTDTAPESILALTFTESGTRAMRERLLSLIGEEAYRVAMHTFHGFSERLIREYPEAYGSIIGGRAIGDVERIDLVTDILSAGSFAHIRPLGDPSYYVKPILDAIQLMKREYITPDTFAGDIAEMERVLSETPKFHEKGAHKGKVRSEYQKREKALLKDQELLDVYRKYNAALRDRRLYDYEDMIVETVRALETNEDMQRDVQEQFQYILADEHQDVNGSQNRILELLSSYHEHPNLFVVGDEKQAIYRFQGASLENFLYFEEKYPGTKTIALTENYRSGQTILDAAHSLITSEEGPSSELRVPLVAATKEGSAVTLRHFTHQGIEDDFVVTEVKERIAEGTPPEEIAVILRTNREVESMTSLLEHAGVRAASTADGSVLQHPIGNAVRDLMAAVSGVHEEEALARVLHAPYWKLGAADVVRVLAARSFTHPLALLIRDDEALRDLALSDKPAVRTIGRAIDEARQKETTEPPHRVLAYVLEASGFLDHVMKEDPLEGVRIVRRMYDEIEGMVLRGEVTTLRDVERNFASRETHNLPLTAPYLSAGQGAVSVMTAHKAKGLEFTHVIIPHTTDSGWGGKSRAPAFDIKVARRMETAGDPLDDERRLLYVALTRGKRSVSMSYADQNADGRAYVPSRLLAEIDPSFLSDVPTETFEREYDAATVLKVPVEAPNIELSAIRSLFLARGLSATSLNNYLESPWTYLYRSLLRIPEVRSGSLLFGSALHGVMESVTKEYRETGTVPCATRVKELLDRELGRLAITAEEHANFHEKGLAALSAYLAEKGSALPTHAKEEFSLRVTMDTGLSECPSVTLSGKLDRLDLDEEGNAVRVVDYKTGKPKTRGQIAGTTKDSNGNYKRQLVFYALLLSLHGDERKACREGVMSFLQPDGKGKIHEETFLVTDEEIAGLKEEIIGAVKDIWSGEFLNTPCDPAMCNYCDLAEQLKTGK